MRTLPHPSPPQAGEGIPHGLDTVLLKGPTSAVRRFADALTPQRGVRHGQLNLITVEVAESPRAVRYAHAQAGPHAHEHSHGAHGAKHPHVHLKPRR